MLLNTERLQYLVCIAETGSFSAAARKLNVSASAVNQAVQAMEIDIGIRLFERVAGKSPSLTPEGKALYFQALEIVPRLQAIERKARALQSGEEPSLTIATHSMTLYPRFAELMSSLTQQFPELELILVDAEKHQLSTNDEILGADIMIAPGGLCPQRGSNAQIIDNIEWCFITSPNHPLAKLKGEITPEDLEQYPQLLSLEGKVATSELLESLRFSPRLIRYQTPDQLQDMLFYGAGFATYPIKLAQPFIDHGLVTKLNVGHYDSSMMWPVELSWRSGLGTVGTWFIEQVLEQER
ncbi:LysR family transcriptional regulator [Vibrio mediterranei]|uniref:LysR family transcriptional regulator n=1 Tax=Vibrio mediterranei TaxID=689 RepID=UPI000783D780|nr:LysR family transcriptional regulator [Vibrio mediterranei]MCG9660822.1 LysR family transcriptional regulator [Vibrio mediterranei]MCG9663325.1 LysR family transcriptional regulator [Vibrio mediterranei]PTC04658.1 LysR family transcriptional regulator [Vibrio mediterranei]SBO12690.1 HTH-type transcriptional activator AllS [Vibrio mediterranei]